jgi:hypothetical protein
MPASASQLSLFADIAEVKAVVAAVREVLAGRRQPSAWELLAELERKLGLKVRWAVTDAMRLLICDTTLTRAQREYVTSLVESDDWTKATSGDPGDRPAREVESTVDALVRESAAYRSTDAFQEMVGFMGNFRDYAPFNNMLVKLQNPSCSFFATQRDWERRFGRHLKDDARPMLILAPMHPVMLVYDLDSTDGQVLPQELLQFAKFEGEWNAERLTRTIKNATVHDRIRIDKVRLSSTNAGFATVWPGQGEMKMRIGLHEELDEPSRYGVLLHELAHVYLGHLGGDMDGWWPCRGNLARQAKEVEAESVAYIVSRRAGLRGTSAHYVSRYLVGKATLKAISLDLIGKVAGRLESMGTNTLGKRLPRRGGMSKQQAHKVRDRLMTP